MFAVYLIFVGLLFICSYHDASTKKNRSLCLRNEYKCKIDGKCTPISWRCVADLERLKGCSDGSHKKNCDEHQCLNGEHRCANGYCIPGSWVCDGRSDCFDRSDEKGCAPVTDSVCLRNQFRCTNGKCIPILDRCDGNDGDCSDGSDESRWCSSWCPEGYARCNTTVIDETEECIPKSYLCDGKSDCSDRSDEKDCDKCEKWGCAHGCNETSNGPECFCNEGYRLNLKNKRTCLVKANPLTCLRNQFACEDGKKCIPIRYRCHYVEALGAPLGCQDGSNLVRCNLTKCSDGEYRCGDGLCIPASWVCDGKDDCIDKSDEEVHTKDGLRSCNLTSRFTDAKCPRNQFRCTNGDCIPIRKRCDGFGVVTDCSDKSDELGCTEDWCPEGYLRCDKPMNNGSKNCIEKSRFCDGVPDCRDGSDEMDCDKCENWGCSQFCEETLPWPRCFCKKGYKLNNRDKRTCIKKVKPTKPSRKQKMKLPP